MLLYSHSLYCCIHTVYIAVFTQFILLYSHSLCCCIHTVYVAVFTQFMLLYSHSLCCCIHTVYVAIFTQFMLLYSHSLRCCIHTEGSHVYPVGPIKSSSSCWNQRFRITNGLLQRITRQFTLQSSLIYCYIVGVCFWNIYNKYV
jgi:hypothetical protein